VTATSSRPRDRALWSAVDQGLSSSTNFLTSLGMARYASERAVGRFAVAFAIFQIALTLSRALCSDPYMIAKSATDPSLTDEAAAGWGAMALLGAALAVPTSIAAAIVQGPIGTALAVFALVLPVILLQDMARFILVTHYRPRAAAANDLVWLLAMTPWALVFEFGDVHPSAAAFLGIWGGGAAVAVVVAVFQIGHLPQVRRARSFLRSHRRTWSALVPEVAITSGATWIVVLVLLSAAGSIELGHLRTVQTLFGPLSFAQLGAVLIVVPEGARLSLRSVRKLRHLCEATSAVLAALAGLLAATLLLLPSSLLVSFIGPIWHSIRPLVPAVACMLGAAGLNIGAIGGLRALGRSDLSFRARAATAPVTLVAGVVGALADGARGMSYGLALGEFATAFAVWSVLLRHTAEKTVVGPAMVEVP
jgi:O-antigen/teichoic acid export membrane protein